MQSNYNPSNYSLAALPMSFNPQAQESFVLATMDYIKLIGDPVGLLDASVKHDPKARLASALKAVLLVINGATTTDPTVQQSFTHAITSTAAVSPREELIIGACKNFALGYFQEAEVELERSLNSFPLDLLALKLYTDVCFFSGRNWQLRYTPEKFATTWLAASEKYPHDYGYFLGIYSFGVEETFEYKRALSLAEASTAINPHDSWAIHTAAHVYEMQGEFNVGLDYLDANKACWTDSSFKPHLWWHYCLFLLQTERANRFDRVIEIFDAELKGKEGALELVDAASLLWRLELAGHVVDSGRWAAVFNLWKSHIYDRIFVFNDLHIILSAWGSKTDQGLSLARVRTILTSPFDSNPSHQALIANQETLLFSLQKSSGPRTHYEQNLELAQRTERGLFCFVEKDYAGVVELLERQQTLRYLQMLGGSHAQRDIIAQTVITAMKRLQEKVLRDRANFRNPIGK